MTRAVISLHPEWTADEALAEGILRGGMEEFVDHWMGLPLFATQGKLPPKIRALTRERKLKEYRMDVCSPPLLLYGREKLVFGYFSREPEGLRRHPHLATRLLL